jgi:hypothetical protein
MSETTLSLFMKQARNRLPLRAFSPNLMTAAKGYALSLVISLS